MPEKNLSASLEITHHERVQLYPLTLEEILGEVEALHVPIGPDHWDLPYMAEAKAERERVSRAAYYSNRLPW